MDERWTFDCLKILWKGECRSNAAINRELHSLESRPENNFAVYLVRIARQFVCSGKHYGRDGNNRERRLRGLIYVNSRMQSRNKVQELKVLSLKSVTTALL